LHGARSHPAAADHAAGCGGVLIALREHWASFNAFSTFLPHHRRMGRPRAESVRGENFRRDIAARLAAGALALAALAGCTQAPVPQEALAVAEIAVARARTAGAERHAPVELTRAEEKLRAAHAAVRARANGRARTLAEQALVDAELAEVEAQAAQAGATARRLRQRVEQQHRRVAPGAKGA
jgi:Domain of unknown function (DUF4398)